MLELYDRGGCYIQIANNHLKGLGIEAVLIVLVYGFAIETNRRTDDEN